MKSLKNNNGFTLLEIIVALAISAIMFGLAAETLINQAEISSFISGRKTSIADLRHALGLMTDELQHINTADIIDISSTKIEFYDEEGNATCYELGADGSDLAIYRGNDDVLLPHVNDFDIEYQDGDGNTLSLTPDQIATSIAETRRIKLSITTEPKGNKGTITLNSLVIPREFLGYSNYQ